MRSFDDLVAEALAADVDGWGWGFLDGRATEERPPWGYARALADRLAVVGSALDVATGGGEVVGEAPVLPPRMVVTEAWPPNARRARELLEPRGVEVVETTDGTPWPLPEASFELVTSRHPVSPDWSQIHRVLAPGGTYFAQHVGPASAFELIEHLMGPLPADHHRSRHPDDEAAEAEAAGLRVRSLRRARLRMEFHDVGAVVWTLRRCVWWVPGFTVEGYEAGLRDLDAQMRAGHPFVAHSSRHLVEVVRPG